jgi:S1-C subfamily serine protease
MTTESLSLSTLSSELAALVERASRFVVSLNGRRHRPGCAIVLGPELIVTADHTLERDEDLTVEAGGARYTASIAGRDPITDIAVLRVPGLNIPEPPRAEASKVGEFVVSLSRTGAGSISAGIGIVAAIGGPLRTGRGVALPQVIRTDAATRRFTSGGAIVDASGRVIGMTTTALLRGLPVAIPATQLWQIAEALKSGRGVRRGYLGVALQPARVPERQRAGRGARALLVMGVAPEGAADRAGVLVGDLIVGLNDRTTEDADDLQDALGTLEPGGSATLDVIRAGALQRIPVTVGERPNR